MKTMHGAFASACWNRSRMRAAPTPTNISTNSEPLRLKNGTCASPATARASSVLPVPGGPTSSTPFGIRPPRFVYFFGFFRNSTISFSSSSRFVDAGDVGEAHLHFVVGVDLRRLRANDITPPSAPPMRRKKKPQMPTKKSERDDPAEQLGQPAVGHLAACT